MTRRLASLMTAVCLLGLWGCDPKATAPASSLPTTRVSVGSKTYELEIAAKFFDRETGLMHRDAMPADHGMIFVFKDEHEQGFWMKDTRIPLDIVYLNDAGKVVSVHRMEPYKTSTVPSEGAVRFAIELNADQTQANGIKKGDVVAIPESIKRMDADR